MESPSSFSRLNYQPKSRLHFQYRLSVILMLLNGPENTLEMDLASNLQCVHDQSCNHCIEIAELNAKISSLEARVDALKQARRVTQTELNRNHDSLVQQVPLEIASYIFSLAVQNREHDAITNGYRLPTTYCRPLQIASVCRRWREIAFSEPELWTTLDLRRSAESWDLSPDLVKQWLARSGKLPLYIALSWKPLSDPVNAGIVSVIEVICAYSGRWRSLNLEIPTMVIPFFKCDTNVMPDLDIFTLDTVGEWPTRVFNPVNILLRPSRVVLGGLRPSSVQIQWDNVTKLALRPVGAAQCIDILRMCPRVVKADFLILGDDSDDTPGSLEPVILSHLRNMTIDFAFGWPSQDFLELLTTPTLHAFHANASVDGSELPLGSLESMFSRSACSLGCLGIAHATVVEAELLQLLEGLPSLRSLFLTFGSPSLSIISDRFFGRLSTPLTSEDPTVGSRDFLPRLESLNYTGPQSFSWSILADIYQAHSEPLRGLLSVQGNPRPLDEIYVTTPDPLTADNYIDKDTLLRFFELPKNSLRLVLNEKLMKKSMDYHNLTPPNDRVATFYYLPYRRHRGK